MEEEIWYQCPVCLHKENLKKSEYLNFKTFKCGDDLAYYKRRCEAAEKFANALSNIISVDGWKYSDLYANWQSIVKERE